MNKKRLEEVKDTYQSVESLIELGDFKQADIAMCYLVENFGKWLIEQAERAQELEKALAIENKLHIKADEDADRLDAQNKRFREVLETIRNMFPLRGGTSYDRLSRIRKITEKALRDEE